LPAEQAEQVFVVTLQTGAAPTQAVALVAVQATHVLVVELQAGVDPLHALSIAQTSHSPVFTPVKTQAPLRH
jgi:hypothetical protein